MIKVFFMFGLMMGNWMMSTSLFATGIKYPDLNLSALTINFWEKDHAGRIDKMASSLVGALRPDFILGCEVWPREGDQTTAHKLAKQLNMTSITYNELAVLTPLPIKQVYKLKLKHKRLLDRFLLVVDIKSPIGPLIRVASLHLAHEDHNSDQPQDIRYAQARAKQLNEILDYLEKLQKTNPAAVEILGGDFNMLPFEIHQHKQSRLLGWSEGNLETAPTWRHISNNVLLKEAQRLDYLFYRTTHAKIEHIHEILLWQNPINGIYLSDHLGVFQKFRLSSSP